MLELKDIKVTTPQGENILENVNVKFSKNSTNLILGPNGSGKTTLAETIAGITEFKVTGEILLEKENITKKPLNQRSKMGIFLAYQNPIEIPGVKILDFLHTISQENMNIWEFYDTLEEKMKKLNIEKSILERNLNEGFSGGEKKKFEILQMLVLKPKVAILDEIDSGLDIDSIKEIFKVLNTYKGTKIVISHNTKILKYIEPTQVIVMQDHKIKETGNITLAKKILKHGYK